MERSKYLLTYLFITAFTLQAFSSENSEKFFMAYTGANMRLWKTMMTELKSSAKTPEEKLELANAQYGYVGWCIGTERKAEAESNLIELEATLNYLENKKYMPAVVYAYKSASVGFHVGLNKFKAPIIGAESVRYAKKAMETDPNQPWGYIMYANYLFHTPALFGGSKKEALQYFDKAHKLFELKYKNQRDWNYINLLTSLARTEFALGDKEKAVDYLKQVMRIAPNFGWVKNELYPKYIK